MSGLTMAGNELWNARESAPAIGLWSMELVSSSVVKIIDYILYVLWYYYYMYGY